MGAPYVITSQESTIWQPDAPTSAAIVNAFAQVPMPAGGVSWIDPGIRVTRWMVTGAGAANITNATRVISIDDPTQVTGDPNMTNDQAAAFMAAAVSAALATTSGDWAPATATPFSVANGALSWWQTGQSDITQTRDQFPQLAGRLDQQENPIGPTVAGVTSPTTLGQAIPVPTLAGVSDTLMWIALGGVVLLALVYTPEIKGVLGMLPKGAPKKPANASTRAP